LNHDSFTVKSVDGSEGLGKNPTDQGRKSIKVSVICDLDRVSHAIYIAPADIHDSKFLIQNLDFVSQIKGKQILADKAYSGWKYIRKIYNETGVKLISVPKRTRSKTGWMLDELSDSDKILLHTQPIELLNNSLRIVERSTTTI